MHRALSDIRSYPMC